MGNQKMTEQEMADYMRGQQDCKDGKACKKHESERYVSGYGDQYTIEAAAEYR